MAIVFTIYTKPDCADCETMKGILQSAAAKMRGSLIISDTSIPSVDLNYEFVQMQLDATKMDVFPLCVAKQNGKVVWYKNGVAGELEIIDGINTFNANNTPDDILHPRGDNAGGSDSDTDNGGSDSDTDNGGGGNGNGGYNGGDTANTENGSNAIYIWLGLGFLLLIGMGAYLYTRNKA